MNKILDEEGNSCSVRFGNSDIYEIYEPEKTIEEHFETLKENSCSATKESIEAIGKFIIERVK